MDKKTFFGCGLGIILVMLLFFSCSGGFVVGQVLNDLPLLDGIRDQLGVYPKAVQPIFLVPTAIPPIVAPAPAEPTPSAAGPTPVVVPTRNR